MTEENSVAKTLINIYCLVPKHNRCNQLIDTYVWLLKKATLLSVYLSQLLSFRPICARFRPVSWLYYSCLFTFWLQLWLLFLAITSKSAQNYYDDLCMIHFICVMLIELFFWPTLYPSVVNVFITWYRRGWIYLLRCKCKSYITWTEANNIRKHNYPIIDECFLCKWCSFLARSVIKIAITEMNMILFDRGVLS